MLALSTETTCPRRPGAAEGQLGDPLDLLHRVDTGVVGDPVVAAPVPEVDATRQLAHDQQIRPAHPLRAQRARVQQGVDDAHRAQVREQLEALAETQQALLGPRRARVRRVPLRAADCAEQDRVRGAAFIKDLGE
jgi:hypothetical protein